MKKLFSSLVCIFFQLCATSTLAAEPLQQEWKHLIDTGLCAYQQRDLSSAERWFAKAVLKSRFLASNDPRRAYSISNLALVFVAQGRGEEAKPLFTKAIQLVERSHKGPVAADVKSTLKSLADNPFNSPKYKSAERLYLQTQAKLR